MSLLNDGKLQRIVGKTLGGPRLFGQPMTHRQRDTGTDADGAPPVTFVDYPVSGTPLDISAWRRQSSQIPDEQTEIIVYQYGAQATPAAQDVIVDGLRSWQIVNVMADPAAATWVCRVTPA